VKELRKKSIFVFVSRLQKNPNVIPIETERWLNLKK
jgi:hypothetical protein